ncbi:hypothetical protein [Tessaracoccus oleiagri]|uniref:Lipoprotein n=1 Tax=Tessaracoccus oleiagri TaxID=686624 RepID=A0A1G9N336_9ACTN|nr:hypothetical protein [Tessaracoccus oleiagri]SDL80909.1 hypothetical protein SAMN04488242_2912 [Tessaracoccus oleiagri]
MKKFVALAVASLGLAVGCTSQPEPDVSASASASASPSLVPSVSSSPSVEPSPSPKPSPSPTSTLSPEQEAAVETVLEYFRLKNEIRKDPSRDFQPLADITTGQIQRELVEEVELFGTQGFKQVGDVTYEVQEVGAQSASGLPVQVCSDSSGSDVVNDATGESVLTEDRAHFVRFNLTVLQENNTLKVASGQIEEVSSCDG